MSKPDQNLTLNCLVEKVERHEALIAQLVEIIGITNSNVKEILIKQNNSLTVQDVQLLISSSSYEQVQ